MKRTRTLTVRGSHEMTLAELVGRLEESPGVWHRIKRYRDPLRGAVFARLLHARCPRLDIGLTEAGVLQARVAVED